MGVMVHKETQRKSDLNDRIAADLRARTKATEVEDPDFVEGSDYMRNMKKTGRFSWFWFILVGLALLSLILIVAL